MSSQSPQNYSTAVKLLSTGSASLLHLPFSGLSLPRQPGSSRELGHTSRALGKRHARQAQEAKQAWWPRPLPGRTEGVPVGVRESPGLHGSLHSSGKEPQPGPFWICMPYAPLAQTPISVISWRTTCYMTKSQED